MDESVIAQFPFCNNRLVIYLISVLSFVKIFIQGCCAYDELRIVYNNAPK